MPNSLAEIVFQDVSSKYLSNLEFLTSDEHDELEKIANQKRRQEWLAGRWASKQAVSLLLSKNGYSSLHPSKIGFSPSNGSPPQVRLPKGLPRLTLSRSHADGLACAAATLEKVSIGIDLQDTSSPVDFDLLSIAFLPQEQQAIEYEHELLFIFWTAKEALAKALGVGLTLSLQQIEIILPSSKKTLLLRFQNRIYLVRTSTYDLGKSRFVYSICQIWHSC